MSNNFYDGRNHVLPKDVKTLLKPVVAFGVLAVLGAIMILTSNQNFGSNLSAGARNAPISNSISVGGLSSKVGTGTAGNTLSPNGDIYVADTGNNRIQVFDSSGNYIAQWGSFGNGNGQFYSPKSLAKQFNNIYVVDTGNNRIQKFDASGNYLLQWGSPGSGNGQFNHPEGVAVDLVGNVYIVDTQNYRVQKFTSLGVYLTQWGSPGSGNGQFGTPIYQSNFFGPEGITVDSLNNIYVVDTTNFRIQKFDSNGMFISKFGGLGSGNGYFLMPTDIIVDSLGYMYVTEMHHNRVQKFDPLGNYVAQWGPQTYEGITIDSFGNLYIVAPNADIIQKSSSSGNFLLQWGGMGNGSGQFSVPEDIDTDPIFYIDLSVVALTATPSIPTVAQLGQLKFIATIRNNGNATATVPVGTTFVLYQNSIGTGNAVGTYTTKNTLTIAPSATTQVGFVFTPPANFKAVAGPLPLVMNADDNNQVAESDETNNSFAMTLKILP